MTPLTSSSRPTPLPRPAALPGVRGAMASLKIHCPQCRQLMAVVPELVGRKVRCPNCSHVTHALETGPATPPPPASPPDEDAESIFAEATDDDSVLPAGPRPAVVAPLPVPIAQ